MGIDHFLSSSLTFKHIRPLVRPSRKDSILVRRTNPFQWIYFDLFRLRLAINPLNTRIAKKSEEFPSDTIRIT